jgi:hypothetical protein
MRLKKSQKEALLAWISEGLQTDEINERAALEEPPFRVSRQQVDGYRDRRALDLQAIQKAGEHDALSSGLAVKAERVKRLQQLAALMERDLFGGFLWTDQVKVIGTGDAQKEVEYEEFNTAEVQQYRGTLDDIAKEMGHRRTGVDLATKELEEFLDRAKSKLPTEQYAALLALASEAG